MALNGRIPLADLARLGWDEADHLYLTPLAAYWMNHLAAAFAAYFGRALYLSDAYRTYDQQVTLKALKGKYAATPGTSNHGWGLAIDAASRVNVDGSAEHRWFEDNAPRYGWINPYWAVDYDPSNGQHEPWHWEFKGAPKQAPAPTTQEDDMAITDAEFLKIRESVWGQYVIASKGYGPAAADVFLVDIRADVDTINHKVDSLAAAIAAIKPGAAATVTIDYAALAKAVNDDAARRMQA